MNTATLKPCRCGAAPLEHWNYGRRMGWALMCPECYAITPLCRSAPIATALWNKGVRLVEGVK